MKPESKKCQNCKLEFIIEPDDFLFYEKIKVPPPTFCPECRLIRRLASRESRPLYRGKCRNCDKELISIFANENDFNLYCTSCWWGDEWDPLDFGFDYDFSRPFFEQFYELQRHTPREASGSRNCENCEFSNGNVRSKNCVLAFDCFESINCYNSQVALLAKDSVDVDNVMNADHAYSSLGSNNIYNTKYLYYSDDCIDSSFLFNCVGCSNCFGCVNLRNKKYYIWNEPYTKEEYLKELKKWDLGSYSKTKEALNKFEELYYKTPRRFAFIKNSENVTGEDIQNSKNCHNCFFTRQGLENCKYIFAAGLLLKDSQDASFGGDRSEIFYETSGGIQSQRCFFSRGPYICKDIEYSERLTNCSDCFGCFGLRNKKFCVLNKQYTKEEYFEMVEKIKKHMNNMPYIDKKLRVYKYGEFFPIELSLWAYNESWGHKYFPLTKEEAIEKGYKWEDGPKRNYDKFVKANDLSDNIKDINNDILGVPIQCDHYPKNCNQQCVEFYNILPNELQFYKQMNLSLPRLCSMCRHYERLKYIPPLKLWNRKCMKEGCNNEFKTAISPERSEIIYCKDCYQAEFI